MGLKQRTVCTVVAGVTALTASWAIRPEAALAVTSPPASRYASIVVDAETGNVLYERNADLPRHPASLTKIMTLYLTFEALASKKIALGDELPVSPYAAGRDPSRLDLSPGSRLKLEDAIRAITTKSANDAACVIGEALGHGNEKRFAQAMTAKAKALGLVHTRFVNASGLPEDGQTSSARDMALLCKALIQKYPDYYRYFSTDTFDFHGTRFPNQNRFLHTYYGADGIKTGFVNASGHNLAASAVRGGKRLIAIVLGGDSQAWTREHTARLLDTSYAKIDPSLVMVASNATPATNEETAAVAASAPGSQGSTGAPGEPAATASPTASAPAPAGRTYSTPAGAVTVSTPPQPLPLPNGTANLSAYAAAAAAKLPAGSVGATTGPAQPEGGPPTPVMTATAPVPTVPAVPAPSIPALATKDPAAAPASPKPSPATVRASGPAAQPPVAAAETAVPASAPSPPTSAPAETRPGTSPDEKTNPVTENPAPAAGAAVAGSAGPARGDWSVQVGLFRDATVARRRGEEARQQMPLQLRGADLVVGRALDGVHVTSRISRLSEEDARAACNQLQLGRVPCVVVPPGRPMVVATN